MPERIAAHDYFCSAFNTAVIQIFRANCGMYFSLALFTVAYRQIFIAGIWNKPLFDIAVHGLLCDLYTVGIAHFFNGGIWAISHRDTFRNSFYIRMVIADFQSVAMCGILVSCFSLGIVGIIGFIENIISTVQLFNLTAF